MFVRAFCENCAENGSQIGWKVSELQAVFQSCPFSTFTAFPCSLYSTGKPVVLSQLFPTHFTQIQQYSPLQDVFSQLNKADGSRIEGKKKRYLVNFSTNPTSPDTELLIIVILFRILLFQILISFAALFPEILCTTQLHICVAKVSEDIYCVRVMYHPPCSELPTDNAVRRGQPWTAGCSLPQGHWPGDERQLTGGGQCRRKWGPLPSPAAGEAGYSARTVGAVRCSPIIR